MYKKELKQEMQEQFKMSFTKELLKEWRIKKQVLFICKAHNDVVVAIDKECKEGVLKKYTFIDEETKERIIKPFDSYKLSKKDFKTYCKLTHSKRLEKGLVIKKLKDCEDYFVCSDAITKEALQNAERDFLKTIKKVMPEPLKTDLAPIMNKWHWKLTPELIESSLRLNLNTVSVV